MIGGADFYYFFLLTFASYYLAIHELGWTRQNYGAYCEFIRNQFCSLELRIDCSVVTKILISGTHLLVSRILVNMTYLTDYSCPTHGVLVFHQMFCAHDNSSLELAVPRESLHKILQPFTRISYATNLYRKLCSKGWDVFLNFGWTLFVSFIIFYLCYPKLRDK